MFYLSLLLLGACCWQLHIGYLFFFFLFFLFFFFILTKML